MHGTLTRKPLSRMRAGLVTLVLFLASNGVLAAAAPLAEEMPPIGKGHMLSEEQITYCLAQSIRVEAIRTLVNRYRREQVDFFNAVVAAFNARCQSYRYEGNARDNAKAEVEAHHAQIEADARDSYAKRFPAQEKEQEKAAASASAPTAPSSAASAPSTPPTMPSSTAAKPAPSVSATEPSSSAPKPASRTPATETSSVVTKPGPTTAAGGPNLPATPVAAATPAAAVAATVPARPSSIAAAPTSDADKPAPTAQVPAPITGATAPSGTATVPSADAPKSAPSVSAAAPSTPPAVTTPPKSARESSVAPATASEPRPSDTRATTNAPPQPAPSTPGAAKPEPALAIAQPPASSKPTTPSKTKADVDAEAALDRFSREIRRAGSQVVADSSVPAAADKGTTQIDVRYATGGYIKSINVGESSGYPALDERALDIARNTRFPNVPQELQSRDFVLRFPIVFRSTAAR